VCNIFIPSLNLINRVNSGGPPTVSTNSSSSGRKFLEPNDAAKAIALSVNPSKTKKIQFALQLPYSLLSSVSSINFGADAQNYLSIDIAVEVNVIDLTEFQSNVNTFCSMFIDSREPDQ
jgi:hypothetical protein